MERRMLEPTLLDGMVADLGGPRTAAFFERCEAVIPFAELAASVGDVFADSPAGGRPHWPVQVLVKCVLLAKWFNLSDPQLEEMIRDRLSFRRFLGLSVREEAPDETTICVFRRRLREAGHARTLFDRTLELLRAQGLALQEGTLVDATIVDAPQGGRSRSRDPWVAGEPTRDRCASYTKNHGTLRHGYKAHLAVSRDRLVIDYVFDTARVHDSRHFEQLTGGETEAVYADSAYMSGRRSDELRSRGVHDGIVERRVRGQAELTRRQKDRNRRCSRVRALVEHPRAWMKQMGYARARYRGLMRNALDLALQAVAYNWKRSFSLLGLPLTPPPGVT